MKDYADNDRQDLIKRVNQHEDIREKIRATISQDSIQGAMANWFVQGKLGVERGALE